MATERTAVFAIPGAATLLLWPAVWNSYPIVFADTGTYLTQAIHLYAGWDRPVFYSLFMLPLHETITLWPVVIVQAVLAAWVLWLVCRVVVPEISAIAFVCGVAMLSACTWLPWIVSELMPDVFTPLLILAVCLLTCVPEWLSRWELVVLIALTAFMIACQQSSLPLACVLFAVLGVGAHRHGPTGFLRHGMAPSPRHAVACSSHRDSAEGDSIGLPSAGLCPANCGPDDRQERSPSDCPPALPARPAQRLLLAGLPPALAILALCTVNLAAHGRFAISPFGNVFLLARVIYDGPGMAVLRRDCPAVKWRLCAFLDRFPPTSDDFLWAADGPLDLAGGPKAVSLDAGAIIEAALIADPIGEARAVLGNMREQLSRFASGDGLNPWPSQVSPAIKRDFPAREEASYAAARQQAGLLSVHPLFAHIHMLTAVFGVVACVLLLPVAYSRRAPCTGFLLAVLLALPFSAAITGGLSAPHDRYQSRIMWLPPFIAVVSLMSLRRRTILVRAGADGINHAMARSSPDYLPRHSTGSDSPDRTGL